jgi:hypothetical protein
MGVFFSVFFFFFQLLYLNREKGRIEDATRRNSVQTTGNEKELKSGAGREGWTAGPETGTEGCYEGKTPFYEDVVKRKR